MQSADGQLDRRALDSVGIGVCGHVWGQRVSAEGGSADLNLERPASCDVSIDRAGAEMR
jgi:hypothetical protein